MTNPEDFFNALIELHGDLGHLCFAHHKFVLQFLLFSTICGDVERILLKVNLSKNIDKNKVPMPSLSSSTYSGNCISFEPNFVRNQSYQ